MPNRSRSKGRRMNKHEILIKRYKRRLVVSIVLLIVGAMAVGGCALVGLPKSADDDRPIEAGKVYEFGVRRGYGEEPLPTFQWRAPDLPGWRMSEIYHRKRGWLYLVPKNYGSSFGDRTTFELFSVRDNATPERLWAFQNIDHWHMQRLTNKHEKFRSTLGSLYLGGRVQELFGLQCSRINSADRALTQVPSLKQDTYFVDIQCPVFVGEDVGVLRASHRFTVSTGNLSQEVDTLPFMQRAVAKLEEELQHLVYGNIRFLYPVTQTVPEKYGHMNIDTTASGARLYPGLTHVEPGQTYRFGASTSSDVYLDTLSLKLPQGAGLGDWYFDSEKAKKGYLLAYSPMPTFMQGFSFSFELEKTTGVQPAHTPEFLSSHLDVKAFYDEQVEYARKGRSRGGYYFTDLPEAFGKLAGLTCLLIEDVDESFKDNLYISFRYRCPVLFDGSPKTLRFEIRYRYDFNDESVTDDEMEAMELDFKSGFKRHVPVFFENLQLLYPVTQELPPEVKRQLMKNSQADCRSRNDPAQETAGKATGSTAAKVFTRAIGLYAGIGGVMLAKDLLGMTQGEEPEKSDDCVR